MPNLYTELKFVQDGQPSIWYSSIFYWFYSDSHILLCIEHNSVLRAKNESGLKLNMVIHGEKSYKTQT
jgi:hypothetical protein